MNSGNPSCGSSVSQKLFPQHIDSQHLKCVSKGERSTLFFQASAIFNIKLEMQWGGVWLTRSVVLVLVLVVVVLVVLVLVVVLVIVVLVLLVVFLCLTAGRSTMGVNTGGLLTGMEL